LSGNHIAFAEDVKKVMENMVEIRPTAMVSVPRLFEKIHSRIYDSVHQASPFKRNLFHYAMKIGSRYVQTRYIEKNRSAFSGCSTAFSTVWCSARSETGSAVACGSLSAAARRRQVDQ